MVRGKLICRQQVPPSCKSGKLGRQKLWLRPCRFLPFCRSCGAKGADCHIMSPFEAAIFLSIWESSSSFAFCAGDRLLHHAKTWQLLAHDRGPIERLGESLQVSPIVAQLLLNRGLGELGLAKRFLDVPFNALHEPALLPGVR